MKTRNIKTWKLYIGAACAIIVSIALAACGNETDPAPTSYTVAFNSNGGTSAASQTVTSGAKASQPQGVTKSGYTLAGWFTDNAAFTSEWDFDADTVTQNITLYAKWTENDGDPDIIPEFFTLGENDIIVSLEDDVEMDLATFEKIKSIFEGLEESLENYGQASFAAMLEDGLTINISADGSLAIDVAGKIISIPFDAIDDELLAVLAAALNDEFYVEPIPESFMLAGNRVNVSFGNGVEPDLATFKKIRAAFKTAYKGTAGNLSDDGKAGIADLTEGDELTVQILTDETLAIDVAGKKITVPVSAINADLVNVLSTLLKDEFYVEPFPESFKIGGKDVTVSFGTGVEPSLDAFNKIKTAFEGLSGLSSDGQTGFNSLLAGGLTVQVASSGSLTINVAGKKITIPSASIGTGLGAALKSALNDEFYVEPFPESFKIGGKDVTVSFGTGVDQDLDAFNKVKAAFEGLSGNLSENGQDGLDDLIAAGLTVQISSSGSLTIDVAGKKITIPVGSIAAGLVTALISALDEEFYVDPVKEGIMKRMEVPTYGGEIAFYPSGDPYGIRFRFIDGIDDEDVINGILAKFEEAWTKGILKNLDNDAIRLPVYNRVLKRGIKMRIENPESGYYKYESVVDYKTLAWHIDYILSASVLDLALDIDYAVMNELNEMEP